MSDNNTSREVRLSFNPGDSETILVTLIGTNRYRMEESSIFGEANFHDVIEAVPESDGTLRFLRVLNPSELKTTSWILSQTYIESLADFRKVVALGGNWERLLGGVLILHLPAAEHDQLLAEFKLCLDQLQRAE